MKIRDIKHTSLEDETFARSITNNILWMIRWNKPIMLKSSSRSCTKLLQSNIFFNINEIDFALGIDAFRSVHDYKANT